MSRLHGASIANQTCVMEALWTPSGGCPAHRLVEQTQRPQPPERRCQARLTRSRRDYAGRRISTPESHHIGALRAVSDDGAITGQQSEVLCTGLRDQHSVERIAVPPRQGDQRPAMVGQHREQIKAVGNVQEALVVSDAV